jgi:hypothetical protein
LALKEIRALDKYGKLEPGSPLEENDEDDDEQDDEAGNEPGIAPAAIVTNEAKLDVTLVPGSISKNPFSEPDPEPSSLEVSEVRMTPEEREKRENAIKAAMQKSCDEYEAQFIDPETGLFDVHLFLKYDPSGKQPPDA